MYNRRGPGPSQAQLRRRYERTHYFSPEYRRMQQEQLQLKLKQEQLQRERLKQKILRQGQLKREQLQRERLKQEQALNDSLQTLCISQLRPEEHRLQQQSIKELRLLQQRLDRQRQQGVEELRLLQQRHREQRLALQQRIKEEGKQLQDNSNILLKLAKENTRPAQILLIPSKLESAANQLKKEQLPSKKKLSCSTLMESLNLNTVLPDKKPKDELDEKNCSINGGGMEDDISNDVLYIPTNYSLDE